MLTFLWIFVWPFVLPLICLGVLARAPRDKLLLCAGVLIGVGLLSAAPLIYRVATSPYPDGLVIASLGLYPISLAAMAATLLGRALIVWLRRRRRERQAASRPAA